MEMYVLNETGRPPSAASPPHHALLACLESEQTHHESCAALSRVDECRIAHSSMAAGLHIAAIRLVEEFEGREAVGEYMRRTALEHTEFAAMPAPDDGLCEQYAAAIRALNDGGTLADLDEDDDVHRLAVAVLAVRDRRMEQLAAGRARFKRLGEEIERDRDRLAGLLAQIREYLETSDDDGIRARQTVLGLLDEVSEAAK